ncbi:LysR family transcriptional regulator [Pseudaminobacter sp. 19-2017]|uniref:LysR family transcriptional regulator n=1 Tax=Pseudaminobacter soli (ex Zhang et al. 2022) TaxID=2831468 RepID=A0A942E024_9HYPH|nr:LysR family transcriptional regulator [Pseudaminobacter soli]MBS3650593.1 LysR family transcriptional regulator [Pseudaminobacter soli]
MELKWLEDFVAVAETFSFSRAADTRHVTQSALSRRIKQLEAWLGATLISRATVPAELTPAGNNFLPVAREAIRTFYTSREMLQPVAEQGMIRLAALHTLTVTFFPNWLRCLEVEISGLRTSLIPDRGGIEANLTALIDGEADFFLTYAHRDVAFHLDRERFDFLTIGSDKVIPVSAPELRIRGQAVPGTGLLERAMAERLTVPYLSYGFSSFFGVALQRLFAARPSFLRRTVHENTISAGLKTLALTGSGLCWLPESLVENELRSGSLVQAARADDWTLDLQIRLYRALENSSSATDTFWRAAQAVAARSRQAGDQPS